MRVKLRFERETVSNMTSAHNQLFSDKLRECVEHAGERVSRQIPDFFTHFDSALGSHAAQISSGVDVRENARAFDRPHQTGI